MLAGAVCFALAQRGMQRLHDAGTVKPLPGVVWGAVAEWERWRLLSWVGVALVVAGIGVAVWAALVARRGIKDGI